MEQYEFENLKNLLMSDDDVNVIIALQVSRNYARFRCLLFDTIELVSKHRKDISLSKFAKGSDRYKLEIIKTIREFTIPKIVISQKTDFQDFSLLHRITGLCVDSDIGLNCLSNITDLHKAEGVVIINNEIPKINYRYPFNSLCISDSDARHIDEINVKETLYLTNCRNLDEDSLDNINKNDATKGFLTFNFSGCNIQNGNSLINLFERHSFMSIAIRDTPILQDKDAFLSFLDGMKNRLSEYKRKNIRLLVGNIDSKLLLNSHFSLSSKYGFMIRP